MLVSLCCFYYKLFHLMLTISKFSDSELNMNEASISNQLIRLKKLWKVKEQSLLHQREPSENYSTARVILYFLYLFIFSLLSICICVMQNKDISCSLLIVPGFSFSLFIVLVSMSFFCVLSQKHFNSCFLLICS